MMFVIRGIGRTRPGEVVDDGKVKHERRDRVLVTFPGVKRGHEAWTARTAAGARQAGAWMPCIKCSYRLGRCTVPETVHSDAHRRAISFVVDIAGPLLETFAGGRFAMLCVDGFILFILRDARVGLTYTKNEIESPTLRFKALCPVLWFASSNVRVIRRRQ